MKEVKKVKKELNTFYSFCCVLIAEALTISFYGFLFVGLIFNDSGCVAKSLLLFLVDVPVTVSMVDGIVKRSGTIGERIGWVIQRDGKTILERNAENELTLGYMDKESGVYRVYLTAFVGGGYHKVSNEIQWEQP